MKNGKFTLHYSFFILHFIILFTNHFFFVFLKRKYLKFVISLFKRMTMQTEVLMNSNMALLILCWQTACLSHEHENGKLLPGASSATEAESAELDIFMTRRLRTPVGMNSTNSTEVSSRQVNVPRLVSMRFSRQPTILKYW